MLEKDDEKLTTGQYITRTARLLLIIILCIVGVRTFLFEFGIVNNRSMEPTFFDNDAFIVNKIIYLISTPKRGDVVQFINSADTKLLVKRIIGLPNETIRVAPDGVHITDLGGRTFILKEPYLSGASIARFSQHQPEVIQRVPADAYFLLGDNRAFSTDSRAFGAIDRSYIVGKISRLTGHRRK